MKNTITSPTFYLSLLEFLMSAKQLVIAVGDEFDLTAMQTMTLLLTKADAPRPMNNFCKLYNCDASNVTGIIDGLEQKGLVSRREDPKDRRIKIVQLEPAGIALQTKIIEQFAATSGELFDPLSAEETDQFSHLISKLSGEFRSKPCIFRR